MATSFPSVVQYRATAGVLGSIIGGGGIGTGAPLSSWTALATALSGQTSALGGRSILLNENDGILVPASDLTWPTGSAVVQAGTGKEAPNSFSAEPQDIVQMVTAGWVWVDRCEVPIAYRYDPGIGVRERVNGFTDGNGGGFWSMAQAMGVTGLNGTGPNGGPGFNRASGGGWGPKPTSLEPGVTYPFPGGMICDSTLSGPSIWSPLEVADVLGTNSVPNDLIPGFIDVDGAQFLAHPALGIIYGNGAYVWAYADDYGRAHVSASSLAWFITQLLSPAVLSAAGASPTVTPPTQSEPPTSHPTPPKSGWAALPWYEKAGIIAGGVLVVGGTLVFLADLKLHEAGASRITIVEGGQS